MKNRILAPFFAGIIASLGLGSLAAYAATFNQFTPANGVLKGNANSPVTASATSSDISALWTGTCNASTFLAGDGTCKVGLDFNTPYIWNSQYTFTSPVGSGTVPIIYPININSADPGIGFRETDASVDRKYSDIIFLNGEMRWRLIDDARTSAGNWLVVQRNGGIFSNLVNITTDHLQWNGFDVASSTSNTFTGTQTMQLPILAQWVGLAGSPSIQLNSTNPILGWSETDSGVDSQSWQMLPSSNVFTFRTVNTAATVTNNVWTATRSGANVTDLSFGNATNNPTYNFLGAGVSTFNGSVMATGTRTSPSATTSQVRIGADITGTPQIHLINSAGIANSRIWDLFATNTDLVGRAVDDTITTAPEWLRVSRSAATISSLTFGNTTNNPAYNFLGSGTTTINGNTTIGGSTVMKQSPQIWGTTNTGNTNTAFVSLRSQNGSSEFGWMGFGAGDGNIALTNNVSGGDINLSSSGDVNVSGHSVLVGSFDPGDATSRGVVSVNGSTDAVVRLFVGGTQAGYFYAPNSGNITLLGHSGRGINFNTNASGSPGMTLDTSNNLSVGGTITTGGAAVPGFAWGRGNSSGTFLAGSSNVTGTSRAGAGLMTASFSTSMQVCTAQAQGSTVLFTQISTTGAGPYTSITFAFYNTAGALTDPTNWVFTCFK